jgi:spore coat polysaccharide biosynthesis protein SpsF (cytidylyltransferase family)
MAFREHATGILSLTNEYDNIIIKNEYLYLPHNININKMKYIKISIDTEKDYLLSLEIANFFNNYDFTYDDILEYLQNK